MPAAGVGGYVVAKLDEGDLEVALLGSTPAAFAVARGVDITNFYVAHEKGLVAGVAGAARNPIAAGPRRADVRHALWLDGALPHDVHPDAVPGREI